jgi:predicted negative regulator of RcsB-dependent stress response
MAYDLEEQEQIDQIKAFWTRWGNAITWGVTAVAVVFAAYYAYKYYQRTQSLEAAPLYEQLEKAAGNAATDTKNVQLVTDLAATLTTKYAGTAYAQMGAVSAAKVQLDAGKLESAQVLLRWVMEGAKDAEYRHIARSRLATTLLDSKKPAEVLALIPESAPKGFETLFADSRGDALAALGKKAEAIEQYQKAWAAAAEGASIRELIEQKLTGLGAESPASKLPVKTKV